MKQLNLKHDFPILNQKINGKPLVYLDSAATTQKPQVVIDTMVEYYKSSNSNVHRGVHSLSERATDSFEAVRSSLHRYINTAHEHEIIFTKGTTDSVNLVAHGFRSLINPGDEILVSELEHHSNLVPWQMLAQVSGAKLTFIPMLQSGELDISMLDSLINPKTKIVAFNHISNALGTVNPVKKIISAAHTVGACVFIDGAQAFPHTAINVQELDVDFYAGSAHKMYGPAGIGLLYGKSEWLEKLPPYQGGGEMIAEVKLKESTYAGLPHKFEAGTPNIEGVIGWGAALKWIEDIGIENIRMHEDNLLSYARGLLAEIPDVIFYGTAKEKAAVISFGIKGSHPYDVGVLLDQMGIAVRTGHHCAQPIMTSLKIPGTVRISLAAYTSKEDIDMFIVALEKTISLLN
jgi:cysteine desulfurase/selenocysteine lyase